MEITKKTNEIKVYIQKKVTKTFRKYRRSSEKKRHSNRVIRTENYSKWKANVSLHKCCVISLYEDFK